MKTFFFGFAYVVLSLLTTGVAGALVYAGLQIFSNYGISLSILIHCLLVMCVMAFMSFVIYTSWKQTYTAIRTGEWQE